MRLGTDSPHRIDPIRLGETFCAVDAIVHVNNAPLAAQPVAIVAAVTTTAAVIDIEHCNSAAGPELDKQVEQA